MISVVQSELSSVLSCRSTCTPHLHHRRHRRWCLEKMCSDLSFFMLELAIGPTTGAAGYVVLNGTSSRNLLLESNQVGEWFISNTRSNVKSNLYNPNSQPFEQFENSNDSLPTARTACFAQVHRAAEPPDGCDATAGDIEVTSQSVHFF